MRNIVSFINTLGHNHELQRNEQIADGGMYKCGTLYNAIYCKWNAYSRQLLW